MILYPLECLVAIRARREESAAGVLASARHDVSLAAAELDFRKHDLSDFLAGKEERLGRVFAAVEGKSVAMRDIDLVREALSNIEFEGVSKENEVVQAEAKLSKCESAVKEAHDNFVSAAKSSMKIDRHRTEWAHEAERMEERVSESEIEESVRLIPSPAVFPQEPFVNSIPNSVSRPSGDPARIFCAAAREVADAIFSSLSFVHGEGVLAIQLKGEVLDGSAIRMEVHGKTLKVVVDPATTDVRALVEGNRCAFEQYLGERINTWRISVALAERRGYGRK